MAPEDQPMPLAAFPPEPERFVGRAAVLAAATAALAPESPRTVHHHHLNEISASG